MGNLESITKKGHSSVMVKLSLHTKIVVYGRSSSQQTHDDMFNTVKHVFFAGISFSRYFAVTVDRENEVPRK